MVYLTHRVSRSGRKRLHIHELHTGSLENSVPDTLRGDGVLRALCRGAVEGEDVLLSIECIGQLYGCWQVCQLLNKQRCDAAIDSQPLCLSEAVAGHLVVLDPFATAIVIACVDGVTICVNRGNEGEVVDSHTCQGVQLLDSLIYTVEVRCSLLNLTIDILLVGELVLAGRAGREQTIDSLEDVIQRTCPAYLPEPRRYHHSARGSASFL